MMETGPLRNTDRELRSRKSVVARLWTINLSPAFPATAAFSALFLVTILLCSQASAQTRQDVPSNAQKTPGHLVPASEELLKKAMKNAKAVTPDDAHPRVPVQEAETKPQQNPGQQKLLPDSSSLPDNTRSNTQKQPSGSKEPASKPEVTDPDANRDIQSGNSEKAADGPDASVWEPTAITVNRVFLATGGTNGEARKVPMNVPVLYQSRLMGLDKDKQRAIARLLDKLVSYRARLAAMRKEGTDLMAEWNQILSSSTPQDLLLSDSPSLIEKQNSDAVGLPGFEPGKGVSILVKSTTPNQ
jgi:hypothetical protein